MNTGESPVRQPEIRLCERRMNQTFTFLLPHTHHFHVNSRLHERPVQSFVDEGRFNTSSDDSPPPPPADTKAKKKNKAANKKKAPKTKAKAKAKGKGKESTVPSSVAESTVDGGYALC